MTGYKAKGTLTLQTGQMPQQYDVEVWHKKPDFYRIALTNREKSITQIILRNTDGVFVLTPHLNKSFRFQSGWPDRQGQVYLYESLVNSVVDDEDRILVKDNDYYLFHVKANYQNRTLSSQKIWFDENHLRPHKVQVLNSDAIVLVELTFNEFTFDPKFEDGAFDMDKNMTSYQQLRPAVDADIDSLSPILPNYIPTGVYLAGVDTIEREDGIVYELHYDGAYHFTITQERPKELMVIAPLGEPIDLGFTVATLTLDNDISVMRFSYEGVDFSLRSDDLPIEEMEKIATSFYGQFGK